MSTDAGTDRSVEWKPTACILCECNCGILVRLGGDTGRRFEQIRGDKGHPASKGYTCQKALRLDHYQNGRGERVLHPCASARTAPSRRSTGTPPSRGRRSAGRCSRCVRRGDDPLLRRRRPRQPPGWLLQHRDVEGVRRQVPVQRHRPGEDWRGVGQWAHVGTPVRGDFEHCEVAVFVGKNPWQSHSFPHAA